MIIIGSYPPTVKRGTAFLMSETVRAFCAMTLDDAAIAAIEQMIIEPRKSLAAFRWVPPRKWHITTRFLGDITTDQIDELSDSLMQCAQEAPIPVELSGMGAFPDATRPRVIWVGLNDFESGLQRLVHRVETICVTQGHSRERRAFRPHITVARSGRKSQSPVVRTLAPLWRVTPHKTVLSNLVLFASQLSSEGSVYTPLKTIQLMGGAQ